MDQIRTCRRRSQTVILIFAASRSIGGKRPPQPRSPRRVRRGAGKHALMSWTRRDRGRLTGSQAGVGPIQSSWSGADFEERLQSFALDKTPERNMRALLRFPTASVPGRRMARRAPRRTPINDLRIRRHRSREIVTFR